MSEYKISVLGCDDTTQIRRQLTEQEFAFLESLVAQINEASTYGCMPTMAVVRTDK